MLDDGGMSGLGQLGGLEKLSGGGGPPTGGGTQTPSLQFSVPCLQVDDEKGPPSFKYVFYELPFPEFPFAFPEGEGFYVANGWCNGSGAHVQRMKILDPSRQNTLVDTGDQPFTLKKREEPFMAVNYITGMRFNEAGTYWMQILLDGRMTLEYPMPVRKSEAQPSAK